MSKVFSLEAKGTLGDSGDFNTLPLGELLQEQSIKPAEPTIPDPVAPAGTFRNIRPPVFSSLAKGIRIKRATDGDNLAQGSHTDGIDAQWNETHELTWPTGFMNGDRERRLSKKRNQLVEKREEVLRSPLEEGHAQGQAGASLWSSQREKRPGLPCLELQLRPRQRSLIRLWVSRTMFSSPGGFQQNSKH